MNAFNLNILLFSCFALGLPLWLMQSNDYDYPRVNGCHGECYEEWKQETGGVVSMAQAKAAARAAASPEELGKELYTGCIACHGAGGEGGIGPRLAGQAGADIVDKLTRYKNGETVGNQSNMMWGQAAALTTADIDNLAAFVESLP